MGRNKALLPLPPRGEPMLAVVARQLEPLTEDLLIIGPTLAGLERLQARWVADAFPSAGPLAGIATALDVAAHDWCIVVACDMPLVQTGLLVHLAQLAVASTMDAVVPVLDGTAGDAQQGWQPLCAMYHRRCRSTVLRLMAAGHLSIQRLFPLVQTLSVPTAALLAHDPALLSFRNVNDPAELARVRQLLSDAG